MTTSTPGQGALPEPNAGAFSPLQPSPVILSTSEQEQEGERQSRAQKPRPIPRKDGSRPSDIAVTSLDPVSSLRNSGANNAASGRRNSSPFNSSTSPSRIGKSSPRHLSPATSQIFERDVQESTTLAPELSPAIPSHITTEDHIPPVLEASSLAITDNYDPDEVEIVMHAAHQPAAATVAHAALGETHPSGHNSHSDLAASHTSLPGGMSDALPPGAQAIPNAVPRTNSPPNLPHEHSNEESTYGAVDPSDPRRLSFISFADVVNAEHAEMAHSQSLSDGTMPSHSSAPSVTGPRSPSPTHSPIQASPPRFPTGQRVEASPVRGGPAASMTSSVGTMGAYGSGVHSELTIETMRQTLQKTGSNDPIGTGGSGLGSQPMSATSAEDVVGPFSR